MLELDRSEATLKTLLGDSSIDEIKLLLKGN